MRNDKSMIETAYEYMKSHEGEATFAALYDAVAASLEMSAEEKDERYGTFYTGLTLDGRFVALPDNTWDLRSRHTYDKVHIQMGDVYSDIAENTDAETEDLEEAKEFEDSIGEGQDVEDSDAPAEEEEDLSEKKDSESLESYGIR